MELTRLELKEFSWSEHHRPENAPTRNELRLFWTRSGSGSISAGQITESMRPYSVFFIGAPTFRVQVSEEVTGYTLRVPGEFVSGVFSLAALARADEFLDGLRQPLLRVGVSKAARHDTEWLLHRLMREDRNPPALFWTSARLTISQLLLMWYQQWLLAEDKVQPVSADAENVIRWIRSYVDEHLNEDFGLQRLSARAGYAPSYLSGLFSRVNGQGLTEYISRKRIGLAQELLRSSNLKIVEICYRVGFKDLAHFNRTFKRFVGATPNQYRHSGQPVHTASEHAIVNAERLPQTLPRATAMIA